VGSERAKGYSTTNMSGASPVHRQFLSGSLPLAAGGFGPNLAGVVRRPTTGRL